jgi:protein-L-isoaspartate(D-aspartate) O-methyltransferase
VCGPELARAEGIALKGRADVDYATQRTNMVESQVRPSDVTDRRILRAMAEVPRELFVPDALRSLAYSDGGVRLAKGGRSLMAPRTFAKLLQAAETDPTGSVLIVGAGTGYSAAVASPLAAEVVALECDEGLAAQARKAIADLGLGNVSVVTGELPDGWVQEAPYDSIVVEGALSAPPSALLSQLKDGGRLVAILRRGPMGKAVVWRRQAAVFGAAEAFDASGDILPGFEALQEFAF